MLSRRSDTARGRRRPRRIGPAPLAALACILVAPAALAQATPQPEEPAPSGGAVPSGGSGAVVVPPKPAAPDASAAVTPPALVHFENAPYPPEAEQAGLEANVVLQLDIDRDGKVTRATVVNPAGHGFDEAAAEAARKFVFVPARRGETPIPARILYRYSFTLAPAQVEEAPAPKPAESLGGSVRVAGGDVPLAGVQVTVKGAGRDVTVTTGEDGSWNVADLPPGKYAVHVAAPGFEKLDVEEEVAEGQATEVVYRIAPAGGALEVTVRGERPPREVTKRTLEQREITRIPGTNGDALKSLQSLPGVARPPGLAGLLVVRGSAPNDTQTFVDGTLIPIVYHFGGLSSVVPSEMLERIDFYPGNFSAQYGRVMGGVVDVGIRSPNADGKYHGMAQVDLIDARVVGEGPVPFAKGWKFIAGARRSWVDVWLGPVLRASGAGVTAAPVYYDWQAFAETNPTPRSTFRVGVLGSDDRLEILLKDPAEQDPTLGGNLGLHTGFVRLQALYRNQITDDIRYQGMLAWGRDTLDFGIGTLYFRLRNYPLTHRSELTWKLASGVALNGGLDVVFAPYEVDVRSPPPPRPGEPDPGPFAARPPRTFSSRDSAWRPAAYLEAELTPMPGTRIVPGARVDYAKDTGRWDLSPRVNARQDLTRGFPRTTLKGGMGIFHQPPAFQETSSAFGTPGLHSNRAVHYSLGAEQELTRHVEVSLEGFYKDLDQLVVRNASAGGGYDYTNLGRGAVVGAEALLRWKPDQRFFGWVAYTLSRSTRESPPDYETRLYQFDQTHILTLLGSYKLGRGWEFGARFRLVSGNLYTPSVGGIYNADAGAYASIDGRPFSKRMPTFHQLDLRVDKQWRFDGWSMRAYLDVQNAYNRSNPEDVSYNYNYSQSSTVAFLPIIPSLGVRGEF